MSRRIAFVFIIVAFAAGVGAGILGILWTTGRFQRSVVIPARSHLTLSLNAATPTPGTISLLGTEIAQINDKVDALSTQFSDLTIVADNSISGAPMAESTADPDLVPTTVAQQGDDPLPERALYRMTEDESLVHFKIDEVLAGNSTTVVATTRRVAGDIIVNFDDPPTSQVGTVAVNVRTLKTDNEFRDQSIRGQILRSSEDEYQFVTFVPVELIGLPSSPVNIGDTVQFQIVGELTIVGATRRVTFGANVTIISLDRIEGFASVEVLYSDFGLTVNPPPTVASVEDEVTLEIELVALRVEE